MPKLSCLSGQPNSRLAVNLRVDVAAPQAPLWLLVAEFVSAVLFHYLPFFSFGCLELRVFQGRSLVARTAVLLSVFEIKTEMKKV